MIMGITFKEFSKDYERWAWQINGNVSYHEDIKMFSLTAKDTSYVLGVLDDGYIIHGYF